MVPLVHIFTIGHKIRHLDLLRGEHTVRNVFDANNIIYWSHDLRLCVTYPVINALSIWFESYFHRWGGWVAKAKPYLK